MTRRCFCRRAPTSGRCFSYSQIASVDNPAWNKPTQVTDANGNTTTLLYYPSGSGASLLETATRPADAAGNHPVYNFNYDAKGRVTDSYVPFQGSQTIRTHNVYDSGENLTSSVVDYGGLALTTSYTYEAQGDVATTKDPRNYLTESKYDNDRRPTYSIHHDGAVVSAAINAESRTIYDALGRETERDAAKCFDTASPCLTSGSTVATWIATRTTAYTPTGKVASVTDADGGVTSTQYDGADRAGIVTDPVLRQTFYTYDPSGNVLSETRGRGTQDQAVYATYTYGGDGEKTSVTDAKGASHLVQFGYDGFNRLIATTYPDATADQVTLYDANGNAKTRVNRANETLSYTYDNLNRMLTKVMPAIAGVNPQVTTSWTYYLNGAVADLSDTNGHDLNTTNAGSNVFFDTAGRLVRTDTTIPGITGALSSRYELDANGNRTKLTWPDGYYATYGYDSLNRMTSAKESGSTQLASYAYDALSRPASRTYRTGMVSSYGYAGNDDDLTSLALATNGSGTLPSYTMSYSAAHQLASESTTGAGYAWQPAVSGTDAYAAVNTLNQYMSWTPAGSTAKSFTYDGNGNMKTANVAAVAWSLAYDPENRLIKASRILDSLVAATYAYDPLGRRTHKSGTGVVDTYFLGDGTDEIAEYTSVAGTPILVTRYIPGRAIDQTIGSVNAAGTRRFYLTDRHGSVVAVGANGGNVVEGPYTYDSYGRGAPTTGAPYKYVGMRLDAETGFYYDRARYYIADLGRFPQPDPVGYTADLNLYPYTNNDPINRTDPTGLDSCQGIQCPPPVPVPTDLNSQKTTLKPPPTFLQKVYRTIGEALDPSAGMLGVGPGGGLGFIPDASLLSGVERGAAATFEEASAANRANEVHSTLDPIAQTRRTTAVLDTTKGRSVAGGARDLAPAQRAALKPGETAVRGGGHAEAKLLEHARTTGAQPRSLGTSRPMCAACQQEVEQSGGTVTSPTTAEWP